MKSFTRAIQRFNSEELRFSIFRQLTREPPIDLFLAVRYGYTSDVACSPTFRSVDLSFSALSANPNQDLVHAIGITMVVAFTQSKLIVENRPNDLGDF